MKIKTICDKKRVGIMVGQVGIGTIVFPWVYTFGHEKYSDISFWEWFFCPPRIVFCHKRHKTCVQLRIMWFAIQAESA